MSTPQGNNRRDQPSRRSAEMYAVGAGALGLAFGCGATYVAAHLGRSMAGYHHTPAGFTPTVRGVLRGQLVWPTASTVVLIGLIVLMATLIIAGLIVRRKRRKKGTRADWAASVMGHGEESEGISQKSAQDKAGRLTRDVRVPGLTHGVNLGDGRKVISSWEDMMLLIAGPRTGKSTCEAIPAILDAPGAALVTSNKRDLVDATRDIREKNGHKVWVFDPLRVANEKPTWWWNPLTYITSGPYGEDDADVRAATLAEIFAANSRPADSKQDGYFDPKGEALVAGLFLAAAVAGLPVTEVRRWSVDSTDRKPVMILREHGWTEEAASIAAVQAYPDKQRDGVYGVAERITTCLKVRSLQPWIVDPDGKRPHFDPATFVREGHTLYSLSRDGRGRAGALVTALTAAVCEAAEEEAKATGGLNGRLEKPLVGVLDEAANVCRWPELPSLYSHYGSRGIVLMTILQSWPQGLGVWGRDGMDALWEASNLGMYGGGNKRGEFLRDLSEAIGNYDREVTSVSQQTSSWAATSTSTQLQRERIFEVSDLVSLPLSRQIIISSGQRAVLARKIPWMDGPHAAAVRASIRAHDPAAEKTLEKIERDAAEFDAAEQDASANASAATVVQERRR